MNHSDQPSATDADTTSTRDALQPYVAALREYFPSKDELLQEARQYKQQQRRSKNSLLLTVCLTLLGLSWYIDPVLYQARLQTAIGEQRSAKLNDGSDVNLNTNTLLLVEDHLYSRQLRLIRGEALFTVCHQWRPFTVYAQQTRIRDIGTVFNVRMTVQGSEVSVLQGSVEVSTPASTRLVSANQVVQTMGHDIHLSQHASVIANTHWQQGRVMFDATPLSQVLAELQRYHVQPLLISHPRLGQYRLSGEYYLQNVNEIIDSLPEILPVNV